MHFCPHGLLNGLWCRAFSSRIGESRYSTLLCVLRRFEEARRLNKLTWRIKPKLHMFQELREFQTETLGDPSTFGTYKDEDFVGLCATIGFSRGGGSTAATTPVRVITRVRGMS